MALAGLAYSVSPISFTDASVFRHTSTPAEIVAVEDMCVRRLEVREVWVTAYSSTPEETDDTPFITASGTEVRSGILAANFLPFGTKVRIPKLFGERVFIVEDRMHRRKENFVDVWMPSKKEAQKFGISKTEIVVLE